MEGSYMILRRAFKMFVERDRYAYFYGCKGEKLTEKRMEELILQYWNEYYSRFSVQALEEIKRFSKNRIGYDCSGFITAITGIPGYSASLYANTVNKTSVTDSKAGALLYKPGHVGIDIGYGYTMHIGSSGATIEIAKIQTVGFTKAGEFKGYDYSEANSH